MLVYAYIHLIPNTKNSKLSENNRCKPKHVFYLNRRLINTINLQLICVLYSEFNVLPTNKIEVDGVEMRFKAVNDINSPDINTIYVGDEFFMFLEYKGSKYCFCFSDLHIYTGNLMMMGIVNLVWGGWMLPDLLIKM